MNLIKSIAATLALVVTMSTAFAQSNNTVTKTTSTTTQTKETKVQPTATKAEKTAAPAAKTETTATTRTAKTANPANTKQASSAPVRTPATISATKEKASIEAKKPADGRTKTGDKIDKAMKGPKGETVYTGERGGKYYLDKSEKRVYITNKQ